MSSNKPSSFGFYRGLCIGAAITFAVMTLFNQLTNSVNIRPMATDGFSALKEKFENTLFSHNTTSAVVAPNDVVKKESIGILPPTIPRKPNDAEKHFIRPTIPEPTIPLTPTVSKVDPIVEKSKPVVVDTPPRTVLPSIQNRTVHTGELSGGMTRSQCSAKYGNRRYFTEAEKRLPPVLYTFPGAGNTWCRLLIEYSTGIYTGAVYNDASLLEPLPGEFKCNHLVSVVKAHPHTHTFEDLRTKFNSDNDKCIKGNVRAFKRAIIVIRDPFDSIWSEFQRRVSKSHVSGVARAGFDWHRWQANACSLSHMYFNMWDKHHASMERNFPPEDYIYIRYEDLKNRKGANVAALKKVNGFLRVPASDERLSCAFTLAENPDAHRRVDESMMTKREAYTKEVVCRMWALFGSYAAKHGYKPINGHDCSAGMADGKPWPPIRNVNVGAQGEYDQKWVTPGQQLIDFGGYNKTEYAMPAGMERVNGMIRARRPNGMIGKGQGPLNKAEKMRRREERLAAGGGVGGGAGGGRPRKAAPGALAAAAAMGDAATQAAQASGGGGADGQGMGTVGLSKPAWQ